MADVHRADVLVRWVGLLPFARGAAAPEQPAPPGGPWETGRRRPSRRQPSPQGAAPPGAEPAPRPLPVPGPPPVPLDPPPLDLGRAALEPEPAPLVDPLLFRGLVRPSGAPSAPRRRRRGAVVDGIEHRPPVRPDPHIVGLSRRLRGRLGSRAFTLVFVGIYLLILVQLIVSLMTR